MSVRKNVCGKEDMKNGKTVGSCNRNTASE